MKIKLLSILLLVTLVLVSCSGNGTTSEADDSSATQSTASEAEKSTFAISEDDLYDKLLGSWVGQMAGVVWGAPIEFFYQGVTVPDDKVLDISSLNLNDAFGQDDIYVEIPFIDAMKKNGVDCSIKILADAFKDSEFGLDHANKIGRENLRKGIEAPLSGSYLYNLHCDDIDWQIESDFVGQLYPGMVFDAANRAFEIGHIMNYGDGVYGGVFVSAMHSAAFYAESVDEIIDAGIKSISEGTLFRQMMNDVMELYNNGKTWQECWQSIEDEWGDTDRCIWYGAGAANIDAKMNSAYILIGLLYGEGDFNNSMKIAMQCGQDNDCNPSSVGAILGNFYGYKALPSEWKTNIDMTGTKFSYTEYTLKNAVDTNLDLLLQVLEVKGFTKTDDVWTIENDSEITAVEFEQWPDMPSVEASVSLEDNILQISLLTYDVNGIKSIVWDMGDGNVYNENTSMHIYSETGTYTVTCTVTNNNDNNYVFTDAVTVEKIKKSNDENKGIVRNIAESGIPVCSDMIPTGSGSKDLNIIRDGVKTGANTEQFDTYVGYMGTHDDYVGYFFYDTFKVSSVVYTEGMHFDNGGWFADGSMKLQAFVDSSWIDVDATISPEYPNGNDISAFGGYFTTYTLTFDEIECKGIRIFGTAGGEAGFIGVAELEVTGVEVE
ncbi:MAG: hypothetical protein A2Y17_05985 [Clostridiales bacterium GWF2_38_85]|nr:MAG: hypothetical protein A2Y17_05985 [Clostridiales bacterium GWF2_38_85]HBL84582.1 hypothetical protein [Clostridiales bacterium]